MKWFPRARTRTRNDGSDEWQSLAIVVVVMLAAGFALTVFVATTR